MKISAIYTIFNGIELLQGSIDQIKNHVDKVLIIYQDTSNRGEVNPQVRKQLDRIKCKNLDFLFFHPDLTKNPKENELAKHDMALQHVKKQGFTHFILLAADHYYHSHDIVIGKNVVNNMDYDVTLTQMFTYYKKPTWQITPIEEYFMPFICKIHKRTKFVKNKYEHLTDPSVRINTRERLYAFNQDEIMFHHYSMIRNSIENKLNNAAASSRWGDNAKRYLEEFRGYDLKSNPGLAYFGGRKIKVVPNHFNITFC